MLHATILLIKQPIQRAVSLRVWVCIRSRHTTARDLSLGERQRKQNRGQQGPVERVVGPELGRDLRQHLANLKKPSDVCQALVEAPQADYADFAKAMQRCGEMRDHDALLRLWNLARERDVRLSPQAYSILITAASRTARGLNGRGDDEVSKTNALNTGKLAWDWMKHDGISPGRATYGAALGLCAKAGDAMSAHELWTQMIQSHHIVPTTIQLSQYLEALVAHGGAADWKAAQSLLIGPHQSGLQPNEVTLSALTNAAAVRYKLEWVDWLWEHVAPKIRLNALVYCTKSKALMLCTEAERVLELRPEMSQKGIEPVFRTFTHEAQALLILLQQSKGNMTILRKLKDAAALARDKFDPKKTSRVEMLQLDSMERLADKISQGISMSAEEAQVLGWPWQT